MDAKLVVVGGGAKPAEVKLKLPAVLGRGREATLALRHPLVSRRHCEIFEAGGLLVVRDMGSLNGTFINDQQITEAELRPGDLLTVGTMTFRAVYQSPEGAGAQPVVAADAGAVALPPDEVAVELEEVEEVDDLEHFDSVDLSERGTKTELVDMESDELIETDRAPGPPPDEPTTKDDDDLLASFADED